MLWTEVLVAELGDDGSWFFVVLDRWVIWNYFNFGFTAESFGNGLADLDDFCLHDGQ